MDETLLLNQNHKVWCIVLQITQWMEMVTTQSVVFIAMWKTALWSFQKGPEGPQLRPVGLVGTIQAGFQFQPR